MKKFNFLERRITTNKVAAELRRQFPQRSATWINARARQLSGTDDITVELRAPQCAGTSLRGHE
ncbi:hypothetical protein [Herbaspirillum sp. ST 5-3]|uniref:hypothetical protein n=1 Tax=Oxalobacteraceae TaxID=75682 RepID=UPI0010A326D5|nr:hypothetical protein [Herbaspirillum sp. ST 5-3]